MVMRETAAVTALGLGIGLIGAAGLSRLMAGLLHGVEPVDPFTYAAVTLVIAAVALMACWLPARRAAGVDPVTALKAE
jgi:ABC-type antimicrobial peptide transport system permease subunit